MRDGKWEVRGEKRSFARGRLEMRGGKREIWKRIDPSLIYVIEE